MILCIDAGTTKCKAAILDPGGNVQAEACCGLEVLRPARGASEMDMEALWQTLCGLTRTLAQDAPVAMRAVRGVGITAQGDGMWSLDAQGKPVRNAILWNDTRAGALGLERDAALCAYVSSQDSTALFAGAFPVILRWLRESEPEQYRRIAHVLHCKDWLNYRLTGEIATDESDQSTAGIDIFRKTYVDGLWAKLGIEEIRGALPPIHESAHVLGEVSEAASRQTGIPAGTPVIQGCIDVVAVATGAGVSRAGDGCAIIGTTLCNTMLIDRADVDMADTNGSALCSVFPGKYNRVMAANAGTSALDFARGMLAPGMDFAALEAGMRAIPAGSGGVLFHPYVNGERAPFREPGACGGFYGLRAEHTPMHLLRAAYEGVAYSLRDCFLAMPRSSGRLYVSGGGARSAFLCGLVADALNREVIRPAQEELGIQGIFRVVLQGLHAHVPDCETDACCTRFLPDPDGHAALLRGYAGFKQAQAAMLPLWQAGYQY